MKSRKILATNIKSLMQNAGIKTQAQLASMTGISQTQIGNILSQKKGASVDILERLATGLECDPWLLLAPITILENFEHADFLPFVHCFMRLHPDDQDTVWKMTHQLYESSNMVFKPRG